MEFFHNAGELWQFFVFAGVHVPVSLLTLLAVIFVPASILFYWMHALEHVRQGDASDHY